MLTCPRGCWLLILTMLLVMMTLMMLPFTNELCKMLLLIFDNVIGNDDFNDATFY